MCAVRLSMAAHWCRRCCLASSVGLVIISWQQACIVQVATCTGWFFLSLCAFNLVSCWWQWAICTLCFTSLKEISLHVSSLNICSTLSKSKMYVTHLFKNHCHPLCSSQISKRESAEVTHLLACWSFVKKCQRVTFSLIYWCQCVLFIFFRK